MSQKAEIESMTSLGEGDALNEQFGAFLELGLRIAPINDARGEYIWIPEPGTGQPRLVGAECLARLVGLHKLFASARVRVVWALLVGTLLIAGYSMWAGGIGFGYGVSMVGFLAFLIGARLSLTIEVALRNAAYNRLLVACPFTDIPRPVLERIYAFEEQNSRTKALQKKALKKSRAHKVVREFWPSLIAFLILIASVIAGAENGDAISRGFDTVLSLLNRILS